MKKIFYFVILLCFSYLILLSIMYVSGLYGNKNFSIGLLSGCLYSFIIYLFFNYFNFKCSKRKLIFNLVLSLIVSCTFIYGFNLENKGTIGIKYLSTNVYIIGLATFIYMLLNFIGEKIDPIIRYVNKKINIKIISEKIFNKHVFIKCLILILIAWLPIFLAFYPGVFSYDAPYQFSDYYFWCFDSGNPIIHTLLIGSLLDLGNILFHNYNIGLLFYSIIQMAVLSFTLSYVLTYLNKKKANAYLKLFTLLIFMFLPTHVLLSFTTTKDVLFSCFVTVFFIKLVDLTCYYEDFLKKKKINIFIIVLMAFLLMIFRPNGLYGFILLSILLLIFMKKKPKIVFLIIALPLILYKSFNYAISYLPSGDSSISIHPLYFLPIQQIGRLYNSNVLTIKEKREINNVFKSKKSEEPLLNYKSHIYDAISRSFDNRTVKKNLNEFNKIYIKYLLKYPNIYIEAFFDNTISYWYIADKYPDDSYYYRYRPYLELYTEDRDYHTKDQIKNNSKIPILYEKYRRIIEDGTYQKVPILSFLMSNAFYNLLLILIILYLLINRQIKKIIPLSFLFGLILTNFLGPVSLTRYCYYLYILAPVILYLGIQKEKYH